jgi:predicted transcriptional regulator
MEVHFSPDVQAKLDQMARDTGRQPTEVIEDAKVQGIDGEEAYRRLMEKTQARRQRRPA